VEAKMKKRALVVSLLSVFALMGIGFSLLAIAGPTRITPDGIQFPDMTTQNTAWISSGNDIYYNKGNVGIGESDPDTKLHVSESGSGGYVAAIDKGNLGLRMTVGQDPLSGALDFFELIGYGPGGGNDVALRANAEPTGVYIKTTAGFIGIRTKSPEATLDVNGDLIVRGNMIFPESAGNKTLQDPAYSSGWQQIHRSGSRTYVHNLGGDPDDYVLKMACRNDVPGIIPIPLANNTFYGGNEHEDGRDGAAWENLNSESVRAFRHTDDGWCDYVSIKIWIYQD
jgi:hypothetical protein